MTRLNTTGWIWESIAGLFFLLLTLTTAPAWAQGEASISGVVTDATGAVIAGATIKVEDRRRERFAP